MGSKDDAKSRERNEKAAATAEQEYIIRPTLARYIDRKDLEKLLLKTFKKAITAYVSRLSYDIWRNYFLVAYLLFCSQDYNEVLRYTASRELTSVRFQIQLGGLLID
jgi:hypothetical protein